jgi:hypothetical protein
MGHPHVQHGVRALSSGLDMTIQRNTQSCKQHDCAKKNPWSLVIKPEFEGGYIFSFRGHDSLSMTSRWLYFVQAALPSVFFCKRKLMNMDVGCHPLWIAKCLSISPSSLFHFCKLHFCQIVKSTLPICESDIARFSSQHCQIYIPKLATPHWRPWHP